MEITTGKAGADGHDFGGWLVGNLSGWSAAKAPRDFGLRQSSAVEIKWGVHRAGEKRNSWAGCSEQRTLSVLVSGKFLLQFRSPSARGSVKEQRLLEPGDYVVWSTDVEHTWIVEEDAIVFTVRWQERAP
jgi:hypothetical protein